MAPDAADGQELRPPSLGRRRNAAGSQEHAYPAGLSGHVACLVNTSNSSMARELPCVFGVAAELF